jgi:hypothetical protein
VLLKRRFIFPLAVALLVSGSSSRLPAQSSTPVLAIVEARVVDGSGNEPFPGTIVVRDGRIAEVGRSVRPPDGARIVDARGRIVTPGLIDVRVHLPAGATDDALARQLAAYLYAGVTSIGVADLDESKIDALRDHLAIARIKAPKLIAALAPSGAMFASTLGSSVPDASALADWKKRNATFVPELVSGAQNDKKLALDRLRAAQQAGVRIAVGSNASGSNPPAGTSTLREIGLLIEGGLTPLQALTAATSGSAWALGLQSDRAFLAVGQRGDLVILSGEPSAGTGAAAGAGAGTGAGAGAAAGSDDASLVEQVFVGGEEVDRAALKAIITPPEAAPPSSTGSTASTATGASGASSAARTPATGETTPAPENAKAAPVKPRLAPAPASGKAAARGKKGRTRPGDAATPATPDTATAPTASAAATPPPASAATEGAAPNHTSPATPTNTTSPDTTPASPTPSATSPSASAAAPAAAGGAGLAAVAVSEPLIDDFESGGERTGLGANWNASNDAGSSSDVIVGRVVRGLRDHALHLTARMGDTAEPYARITVMVAHDGHPADVSQFRGIRFDARGQGRYRVVFITRSVTDGRYHESFFSGSPLWTPVSIPFGTLGQTGAGTSMKWTGSDLLEIAFQIAREPGQMGWLELDNLRFY